MSLWVLTLAGFLTGLIVMVVVANSDLPDFEDLENPQYDLASVIYDTQGIPFGKYYIENREFVPFEDLSPNVVNALLSVEDVRYFKHAGIDAKALLRVAFKSVLLQRESSGGGSTITQQLAKLLFKRPSLSGKSRFNRMVTLATTKFKEWITAVKLEKRYTKEEIVAMYLSKFEFINGAHGIQSAAKIYFDKDQSDLDIVEAATLVGMLKNPALYNPVRFPEKSRGRRNVVLLMLHENDHITRADRDSMWTLPVDMTRFRRSSQSEGLAPYFRSELTKYLRDLLLQDQYMDPDGEVYDIYRDGLKIYTTIDVRYQELAEAAVLRHMADIQSRYWRVWRGMDPISFEANGEQRRLRLQSIERRIRDSDFYRGLYEKYFGKLSEESVDQFGIELREPTVRRLMESEQYLSEIPADKKPSFQRMMDGSFWDRVTAAWERFNFDLDNEMAEEIEDVIFAYNEQGEEIKKMSRRDSVIHLMRHLQAGLLSVDPTTGQIKAWVGGIGHKYFKYDHVTMRRQVGSTIKPFVYATAMAVQGIPPCQEFSDVQYTIAPGDADFNVDAEWSPSNANGLFTKNKYNLYQGLLYSKNSITVRIVKEMGTVEPIRDLLHNVGIDKYDRLPGGRLVVPEVPSLCLGSVDLSLIEMVGGYTTFANNGVFSKPYFIERIEDKNGRVIYQGSVNQKRAINPLYNAVMVDMLRNNTGGRFGLGLKSDNGGKTGTTNDYADGWFIGVTPKLVTGIWVGGDEKWVRFFTLDDGQGFVMARPIFQYYMQAVEGDEEIAFDTDIQFPEPPPGYQNLVDCTRYKQEDPDEERAERMQEKLDLDEFVDDEFSDEFEQIETDRDTLIRLH